MITEEQIKEQINLTLDKTDFPELGEKYEGKVRDSYLAGDKRFLITTDRISAFDRVLGTIPFKGQVLNQIAKFWFDKTKHIVKNHVIDMPHPNVIVGAECKALPVEVIVRGYITGVTKTSAWYNYSNGVRDFCGNLLPEGLKKDQKFDAPIVTPTTKAEQGEHDEPISKDEIISRGLVDKETYEKMEEIALKLYNFGVEHAEKQGLIFVDTKYEFGLLDGELVLIDEINTPDSSRYWVEETYEEKFNAGEEQQKLDKEFVRGWLKDQGFIGDGEIPPLTEDIKVKAAMKYIEAYEKVTGDEFVAEVGNVNEKIRESLVSGGYIK